MVLIHNTTALRNRSVAARPCASQNLPVGATFVAYMCLEGSAGRRAGQTGHVATSCQLFCCKAVLPENCCINALDVQGCLPKGLQNLEFCRPGFASHSTRHFPGTLALTSLIDLAAVSKCGTCILLLACSALRPASVMALGKLAGPDARRKLIAEFLF